MYICRHILILTYIMCGFAAAFDLSQQADLLRPQVLKMVKQLRHRGPDWSGIFCGEKAILAHERLSIVDPMSGSQPLYSPDGTCVLAVNGEIYNHESIREQYANLYDFQTKSDCEVILALYQDKGVDFLEDLNGIFAFALYDSEKDTYMVARDHIGIIPLYQGWDSEGHYYVASELKALEGKCATITEFMPGTYFSSETGKTVQWYKRDRKSVV